jgi:alpha-tubulin suppressor-like RCC1 family protein
MLMMMCLEKGRVYAWGSNSKHQLGNSNDKKDQPSPVLVESLQSLLVQQIVCGGDSVAALTGTYSCSSILPKQIHSNQDISNLIFREKN